VPQCRNQKRQWDANHSCSREGGGVATGSQPRFCGTRRLKAPAHAWCRSRKELVFGQSVDASLLTWLRSPDCQPSGREERTSLIRSCFQGAREMDMTEAN